MMWKGEGVCGRRLSVSGVGTHISTSMGPSIGTRPKNRVRFPITLFFKRRRKGQLDIPIRFSF